MTARRRSSRPALQLRLRRQEQQRRREAFEAARAEFEATELDLLRLERSLAAHYQAVREAMLAGSGAGELVAYRLVLDDVRAAISEQSVKVFAADGAVRDARERLLESIKQRRAAEAAYRRLAAMDEQALHRQAVKELEELYTAHQAAHEAAKRAARSATPEPSLEDLSE